ncbi:MAG: tetratricopeptide repeat protein [Devosiaceae bacterium]|nr:tetratricopeptide repeat protein [Devosiaceae bacterium]
MAEDTIFSEIDEELRKERMNTLWRKFGPLVIGTAVLIVLLVGANEGWRWYKNDIAAKSSDQFYAAIELVQNGDMEAANIALNETIATGSGEYPTLARFAQASLLAREGKTAEAVAAYDALANTQKNTRMREMALLLAATALVDTGDVAGVNSRVAGLLTPLNPLRNVAREALGLAMYSAGDIDGARAEFVTIIADPAVSLDLLRRVQVYDAQLVSEGAKNPHDPANWVLSSN